MWHLEFPEMKAEVGVVVLLRVPILRQKTIIAAAPLAESTPSPHSEGKGVLEKAFGV